MRLRVISPIEFIPAELDIVLAANQAHVVGKLIAPHDGEAGQEDLRSQVAKPRNIQTRLARRIGYHIKVGVIPLDARFIQSL